MKTRKTKSTSGILEVGPKLEKIKIRLQDNFLTVWIFEGEVPNVGWQNIEVALSSSMKHQRLTPAQ